MKSAADLTIELSVYIIQINTRLNSATCTQARFISVNTESIVVLLTLLKTFKCVSFISFSQYVRRAGVVDFLRRTLTFTYTISKQSGVPSTTNIIKPNAFMPTTIRTSAEDLTYLSMKLSFVKIGRVEHLLLATKKVVNVLKSVFSVMAGKNSSSILWSTRPSLV